MTEQELKKFKQLTTILTGTPHFYINNQEIPGAADLEDFEKIIEIELGR